MSAGRGYPLRPWVERAWRGEGGRADALLLRPFEFLYGAGSSVARFAAARRRRPLAGLRVVAIGGLTAGGAGKTTLARWAARAALGLGWRPAILLRGHGSKASSADPAIVPLEAPGHPASIDRFGDEALAHRAALPPSVLIATGKDRRRAARLVMEEGADLVLLDDGWEQGTLAWDYLWVVIDGARPFGNGRLLPAGPLRRPPGNLSQANVIVEISEAEDEPRAERRIGGSGEDPPRVRFRRRVESWVRFDRPTAAEALTLGSRPLLLVSSVGAPDRLERFLRAAGFPPSEHLAFPDHASWSQSLLRSAVAGLHDRFGALPVVVVTDKDAARAASLPEDLEVWVVRSEFEPVDDPAPLLGAFQGSRGGVARDGLG